MSSITENQVLEDDELPNVESKPLEERATALEPEALAAAAEADALAPQDEVPRSESLAEKEERLLKSLAVALRAGRSESEILLDLYEVFEASGNEAAQLCKKEGRRSPEVLVQAWHLTLAPMIG